MLRRVALRLLLALPLAWAVASVVFLLLELAPGDPSDLLPATAGPEVRQELRDKWQLDAPMSTRYATLLGNLATGDLGRSAVRERPVFALVGEALPATLALGAAGLGVMLVLGTGVGLVQGATRGRGFDRFAGVVNLLLYSVPSFWLGLVLVAVFAHRFHLLPPSQASDTLADLLSPGARLLDRLEHLVLPALALGLSGAAVVARQLRESLEEVLGQDHVRTARALGLPEWRVFVDHGLRVALLPVVALAGLSLPVLFSGSVVVERVFAWPGMGTLIYEAILQQDTPLVVGCFFVYGILVVVGSTLADLACAWVDPRVRLEPA